LDDHMETATFTVWNPMWFFITMNMTDPITKIVISYGKTLDQDEIANQNTGKCQEANQFLNEESKHIKK